jgi:hypothetical protein
MICPKCCTAADLMEAATDLFDQREDVWGGLKIEDGPAALVVAAAINHLHAACEGGEQGCGCQHRGTAAATHYADRNQAAVTSPAVLA